MTAAGFTRAATVDFPAKLAPPLGWRTPRNAPQVRSLK
jgi:hypothetical protein